MAKVYVNLVAASEVMTVIIYMRLDKKCGDSEDSRLKFLSIFSPNARKCESEKLRIRTLFTQCVFSAYSTL